MKRIRKHQFYNTGYKPYPEISDWEVHKCTHCDYQSGLDAEQIKSMPIEMVECKSPNAKVLTFWRRMAYYIFGYGINCLE